MAQQASLPVHDPTADQSIATDGMAERPESLTGMRVGLLTNDKLNAANLLDCTQLYLKVLGEEQSKKFLDLRLDYKTLI